MHFTSAPASQSRATNFPQRLRSFDHQQPRLIEDPTPAHEGATRPPVPPWPAFGSLARLGMPLFWLLLTCFILAPCACFLLLAVSPRLFSQGSQWFTLTYLHQALTGATLVSVVNSLWVSCAAAVLNVAIGFPIAWLAARTTLPGRRLVREPTWQSKSEGTPGKVRKRPPAPMSAGRTRRSPPRQATDARPSSAPARKEAIPPAAVDDATAAISPDEDLSQARSRRPKFPIVGVGASAGGLEAARTSSATRRRTAVWRS